MAGRLSAALALLFCCTAWGQADPMRPPAGMAEAPRAADAAAAPAAGESAVQTVILRHGSKPIAVIGGEQVTLGDRVGDARVVKISESEVVLAGPAGRQVLKLNPDVEKTLRRPAGAGPAKLQRTPKAKKQDQRDGEKFQ